MEKLIIDWANVPTYNTLMAICAGASLLSVASVGKSLIKGKTNLRGWAINFGILGLILFVSGAHMSLTWPIKFLPFDNIIFGETCFALGALDIFLAFYFWKSEERIKETENPLSLIGKELSSVQYLLIGLGLGLAFIALAGYEWKFFVAPVEEPVSGPMGQNFPTLQYIGLSSIFLLVGIASILTSFSLQDFGRESSVFKLKTYHKLNYGLLLAMGWFLLVFGAFVFYTHIGLIIKTMPHSSVL